MNTEQRAFKKKVKKGKKRAAYEKRRNLENGKSNMSKFMRMVTVKNPGFLSRIFGSKK